MQWHQNRLAGIRKPAKLTKKQPVVNFFSDNAKIVETIRTKIPMVLLHHIGVRYV